MNIGKSILTFSKGVQIQKDTCSQSILSLRDRLERVFFKNLCLNYTDVN